jgi:hypothetical protein
MAELKLMNNFKEYFDFVNNSTFINNVNTGKTVLPNMYNLQQKVEPISNTKKIVYNDSNFIADNTKIQSNYMNPRGIK